jgi:hypothetical protein
MIINEELYSKIIDLVFPILFGMIFSLIGIHKRFHYAYKYVITMFSTWCYIILSAGSAYIFVEIMRYNGVQMISQTTLNSVLTGIIGPAFFLGIVSKLTDSESNSTQNLSQLKLIRDYFLKYFEELISKKIFKIINKKISDIDPAKKKKKFLKTAISLINAETNLNEKQKRKYITDFDRNAKDKGDYASIIRTLIKFNDIDYIIDYFKNSAQEESRSPK